MTSTGNAFAVPISVVTFVGGPPTTFIIEYQAVVSDGATVSYCIAGSFNYDSTQPVATNVSAFKNSVAALGVQFGLSIPTANILVNMGVY